MEWVDSLIIHDILIYVVVYSYHLLILEFWPVKNFITIGQKFVAFLRFVNIQFSVPCFVEDGYIFETGYKVKD